MILPRVWARAGNDYGEVDVVGDKLKAVPQGAQFPLSPSRSSSNWICIYQNLTSIFWKGYESGIMFPNPLLNSWREQKGDWSPFLPPTFENLSREGLRYSPSWLNRRGWRDERRKGLRRAGTSKEFSTRGLLKMLYYFPIPVSRAVSSHTMGTSWDRFISCWRLLNFWTCKIANQ